MARPTSALIVDDEAHARAYVRLLLKEAGIVTCWEAADDNQAAELFNQHQPELVVLDVNLRATTGLSVLQQIREVAPDMPVIMMTSESALKTVNEAARWGANGYILKHAPKADAVKSICEVLDSC